MQRRGFDPPLERIFPIEGIFPLELTWDLNPFHRNSFVGWEYKPSSSLCAHEFHRKDSIDPGIQVLDGWMPATKTNPAYAIHEEGAWLLQWMFKKQTKKKTTKNQKQKQNKTKKTGHIRKNLTQYGEPRDTAGERRRRSLLVGCLTSQQQAGVSQGRICSDNFACCHTEIDVADQTFYLTQSQYTDTGPTSPSADPITPGAWQGSHWSANFEVTGMTRPRKKSRRKRDSNPGSPALEADALTTRPTRR